MALQDPLKLHQGLVVKRNQLDLVHFDSSFVQGPLNRVLREGLVVLFSGERLLGCGSDGHTVAQQTNRSVVVEATQAQNVHREELSVLRQPDQLPSWRTRSIAALIRVAVRCLACTWRVEFTDRDLYETEVETRGAVLAFWHGEQLPMIPLHAGPRISGVASRSRDGSILAAVIRGMGFGVMRGSSSRGGASIVRQAVAQIAAGVSPALAVDGPRGPRHRVQAGAVAISAIAGVPIVYAVSHAEWAIRLSTWDGFQVPLPCSRVRVSYGRLGPARTGREERENQRALLEERMCALTREVNSSRDDPLGDSVVP